MDSDILTRVREVAQRRTLFLPHALDRMNSPEWMISRHEVRAVVFNRELIEDYPDDPRGHSCLLLGYGEEGRPIHVVCAPKENIWRSSLLAFRPDASHLALAYNEPNASRLMVFDTERTALVADRMLDFRPSLLTYTENGMTLVVYGQERGVPAGLGTPPPPQVLLFDAATLEPLWERSLDTVLSGSWCLERCTEQHGQQLLVEWQPAVVPAHDGRRLYPELDGRRLFVRKYGDPDVHDLRLAVLDTATFDVLAEYPACSNGDLLPVSAGRLACVDGVTVQTIDALSGASDGILRLPISAVAAVYLQSDDRLYLLSDDAEVAAVGVSTSSLQLVGTPISLDAPPGTSVARHRAILSADGSRLYLRIRPDDRRTNGLNVRGKIRVFDTHTWQHVGTISPSVPVFGMAIGADGRYIYAVNPHQQTLSIFDAITFGEVDVMRDNLCLACPTCNCYKAHRQTAPDPSTEQTVALFHPHQQSWTDHFAWSEESTEIVGLTPVGRATIFALRMNRPQLVRVRRMWVRMGEHPPALE